MPSRTVRSQGRKQRLRHLPGRDHLVLRGDVLRCVRRGAVLESRRVAVPLLPAGHYLGCGRGQRMPAVRRRPVHTGRQREFLHHLPGGHILVDAGGKPMQGVPGRRILPRQIHGVLAVRLWNFQLGGGRVGMPALPGRHRVQCQRGSEWVRELHRRLLLAGIHGDLPRLPGWSVLARRGRQVRGVLSRHVQLKSRCGRVLGLPCWNLCFAGQRYGMCQL
jgi:hypothetical protein